DLKVETNADFGPNDERDADLAAKGLEKGKELLLVEIKRERGFAAKEEKEKPATAILLIGKKVDEKSGKYWARLQDERNVVKVSGQKVDAILKIVENPAILRNRDLLTIDTSKVDAVDIGLAGGETIKLRQIGSKDKESTGFTMTKPWTLYEVG